jgi:hypothetical protein
MFAACFMPVCCLDDSSNLKMEAIYFSEASVDFSGLHGDVSHRCENLKSHVISNWTCSEIILARKRVLDDGRHGRNMS